ncbi:hypothetical protein P2A10_17460 [Xanthomonas perforans]
MTERPILFNGPMVRAVLAGCKTQTRRVVKPRYSCEIEERDDGSLWPWYPDYVTGGEWDGWVPCPFGQPGDRLWVKETTVRVEEHGYIGPVYVASQEGQDVINWGLAPAPDDCTDVEPYEIKLRPSIHMPRSMCRVVLEITEVRVDRLQAISDADATAEGIIEYDMGDRPAMYGTGYPDSDPNADSSPRGAFQKLWQSTGGDWDANPWVWVISFRRLP